MYELMVTRDFVAQHFLTVPDCGPENEWHSHHFRVELRLKSSQLSEHGYVVDIDDVKAALDAQVQRFRDTTLNDHEAFDGLNPSVEHFARIFSEGIQDGINTASLEELELRIWEDDEAWASYTSVCE